VLFGFCALNSRFGTGGQSLVRPVDRIDRLSYERMREMEKAVLRAIGMAA
jgi:hypothetical protein